MKRHFVWIGSFLVLMVCLFGACTQKADTPDDTPLGGDVTRCGLQTEAGTFYMQKSPAGDAYALFLPSGMQGDTYVYDGTLTCREEADAASDTVYLTDGRQTVTVTRQTGEGVPSLLLTLAEGEFDAINASDDHSYGAGGTFCLLDADGVCVADGEMKKLRGRGNSTWNGPEKKPYQIEFSEKQTLLGLAKAKKFILLADYYDPSHLRNRMAFDLAEAAGDGWSPQGEPVNVWVDGRYIGLYLLCDKVDIAENKIDIADLEKNTEKVLAADPGDYPRAGTPDEAVPGTRKWFEIPNDPEDITGGYLLETEYTERYGDEVSGFVTGRGMPVLLKSPECASKAQIDYIADYVSDFEDALYAPGGVNEKGLSYRDYIDVDSLAFRYLFEEFVLNIDSGLTSFYFYKDSDQNGGKLNFSCVWDYDCTFGNYNQYVDLTDPETLFVATMERRNNGSMPGWFYALMQQDDFAQAVQRVYRERFAEAVDTMLELLPSRREQIAASAAMDDFLYASLPGRHYFEADSGDTFDEAYDYVYAFAEARAAFFRTQFGE